MERLRLEVLLSGPSCFLASHAHHSDRIFAVTTVAMGMVSSSSLGAPSHMTITTVSQVVTTTSVAAGTHTRLGEAFVSVYFMQCYVKLIPAFTDRST